MAVPNFGCTRPPAFTPALFASAFVMPRACRLPRVPQGAREPHGTDSSHLTAASGQAVPDQPTAAQGKRPAEISRAAQLTTQGMAGTRTYSGVPLGLCGCLSRSITVESRHAPRKTGPPQARLRPSRLSCPLNPGLTPQLQDTVFILTTTSAVQSHPTSPGFWPLPGSSSLPPSLGGG